MARRSLVWVAATALVVAGCSDGAETSQTPTEEGEFLAYADRIDLVVECVKARGFDASSYEGFGVLTHAAGEAALELAEVAEGECWEEVEARYPAPPPLSVEDQYLYMLEVADCLEALGFDVPEPPTVDQYVDSAASQSDMWDPYRVVDNGELFYEIQREECPPYPHFR
ncbi:MAG: hypothetical protein WD651_11465 [Acidimicrobiia bacterium]